MTENSKLQITDTHKHTGRLNNTEPKEPQVNDPN